MLSKFFDPKRLYKKFKAQEGFSLTEMVVVVAIIMVLLTNLIPYAKLYLRKAYKVSDMQEARLIGQTAQLLILENKAAYDSWMYCYNRALTQRRGNFETGQSDSNDRAGNRGDYRYIEDDFSTLDLCPMYRSHFNNTDERRRLFNCVDNASETSDARDFADILHEEMPLVDIQKTGARSVFLMANFGCRKKNQYGAYMRTTSTTTEHQRDYGGYLYGDSYVITARVDDPLFVEVYVSASNAASASYPMYRLYPDVSTTYLALQ